MTPLETHAVGDVVLVRHAEGPQPTKEQAHEAATAPARPRAADLPHAADQGMYEAK